MRPVLFALVQERSPVLMRRILRAGADELLFLPLDAGDATRALLNISDRKKPSSPSRGRQVDPRKEYGEFDGIRSVPERHGSG